MRGRTLLALLAGLLLIIGGGALTALAAANAVEPSGVVDHERDVGANDLKPAACDGIDVRHIVSGDGVVTGTEGNDLILGGPGADTIYGLGGDDCIVGGGGGDTLIGGDGNDVCIGGPGADTLDPSCEASEP